jgi:hypothetical protein
MTAATASTKRFPSVAKRAASRGPLRLRLKRNVKIDREILRHREEKKRE